MLEQYQKALHLRTSRFAWNELFATPGAFQVLPIDALVILRLDASAAMWEAGVPGAKSLENYRMFPITFLNHRTYRFDSVFCVGLTAGADDGAITFRRLCTRIYLGSHQGFIFRSKPDDKVIVVTSICRDVLLVCLGCQRS